MFVYFVCCDEKIWSGIRHIAGNEILGIFLRVYSGGNKQIIKLEIESMAK